MEEILVTEERLTQVVKPVFEDSVANSISNCNQEGAEEMIIAPSGRRTSPHCRSSMTITNYKEDDVFEMEEDQGYADTYGREIPKSPRNQKSLLKNDEDYEEETAEENEETIS